MTRKKTTTTTKKKRTNSRKPKVVSTGKTFRKPSTGRSLTGFVYRMENPHGGKGAPRLLYASIGEPFRTQVSLCYACQCFDPDRREKNCPIANQLFDIAVENHVATPVTRCASFKPLEDVQVV